MLNSSGTGSSFTESTGRQTGLQQEMRKTLENQENLTIKQGKSQSFSWKKAKLQECSFIQVQFITLKAVVLCTGTYLKARCIYGDVSNYTGPNGLQAANYLTDSLKELGIEMFRFKTGTPARIEKYDRLFEDGRAVRR